MSKSRVRLIDIARRLDLSKVSVSKALRDHPDISRETRDLIKRAAKEMGYVPNHLARSLSSQQSRTIGVVVPKVGHDFFSNALDGIIAEAARHNNEVIVTISQEQASLEEKHIETLLSMHVDGILISVSEDAVDPSVYTRVQRLGVPIVFFDRSPDVADFSSVRVDDENGAFNGVTRVMDDGAEVVAHLAGFQHTNIGRERRMGYERAVRRRGLSVDEGLIVEGGFGEQYGYAGYRRLHGRGIRPDAIFCVTFPVAIGMVMAMRAIDPELERTTKIVAFDTGGISRLAAFPYYCIRQNAVQMGERATTEVLRLIASEDARPQDITIETQVFGPDELVVDELAWIPAQEP